MSMYINLPQVQTHFPNPKKNKIKKIKFGHNLIKCCGRYLEYELNFLSYFILTYIV